MQQPTDAHRRCQHRVVIAVVFAVLAWLAPARGQQRSPTLAVPPEATPPRPWAEMARANLTPAEPARDYTAAVVPNGSTAQYKLVDGVKVFHLTAAPIVWEVAKGLTINTWGYNGSVPGPMIEVGVGDRVRIYVTNQLPVKTTVHWHGILLPCGMDGVAGLTQPAIPPSQTFVYEFIVTEAAAYMYHPHFDSMTQEGMGLTGMFIVHARLPVEERPDRDFVIMLHEWQIDAGAARPNPFEMTDFNVLTMNGKAMPDTEPLVAKLGDRVWLRFGNLSAMDHHPIHLHGYRFKIIGTDGGFIPKEQRQGLLPNTTVLVPVGSTRIAEFIANNPGDWLFHCHMTHHTMTQMGHEFPNMVGVDAKGLDKQIQRLIPGYMTMGTDGMKDMTRSGMPIPENSIPMRGLKAQFGQTVLGSMANVLRVREDITDYRDPGPYNFPAGTVAYQASQAQLERDGIDISKERMDSGH